MKIIRLPTHDLDVLVDDEDYERVVVLTWHAKSMSSKYTYYACHVKPRVKDKARVYILMHRFILGITDSKILVDHRDRNGCNNQRYNLRMSTRSQNAANSKLFSNNTSGFKGVEPLPDGSFRARIMVRGRLLSLGTFLTSEKAAQAYEEGARKHFGEFTRTK